MTVETFFANFGHLADAPNGVQKLRELILQLAVQGKLVPQNPSDEPASVLLERIEVEKARLVKERKISKTPIAPLAPEEKNYELPSTWEWIRFGGIAQHNAGKTLDKGRNTGQLRDYITTSNLYWGFFELNNIRQMPIEDEELDRCTAQKGDLLIVEGGEAGRAAVWTKDYDVCFQNHVHRARFYCDIDPFYIYRFFEKLNLSGEIGQYRKGVGISNMSGKSLASIVLPLPPHEEQKRIVAKVDQLMALCDELEARQQKQQQGRVRLNNAALDALLTAREPDEFADHWQRISTNFDLLYDHPETIAKLRAAILQLAVQGKLVPQDPNDEPASVLLERIRAEKERLIKEGTLKKGKAPPQIDPSERPFVGSSSHIFVRLQDVCQVVTDGDHQPPPKTENGIPFLVIGNVRTGQIDFAGSRYVSSEYFEKLDPQRVPQIGDILYTVVGSYGIPVSVATDKSFCVQRHIAIIKPSSLIDADFLRFFLSSNSALEQATACATGIAQKTVPLSGLRKLILSLPPIEEQKRIVAKVNQLMALCDELEAKLNQAQQHSEKLMETTVRQLLEA